MEKTPKKPQKKYNCCACSFASNNFKDLNRHNSTTKHKNATKALILQHQQNQKKHKCKFCDKNYKHRASLFTHNKKCNHKEKVASFCLENASFCLASNLSKSKFECSCGKSYKYKRGLSKHKKKCLQDDETLDIQFEVIPYKNAAPLLKKLDKKMDIIMEENKFLKEKILSLELGTTIHNGDNNNYTINMFLNEKCKNAMNLEDFIEKIKFTIEDLQYTSDNGYANGISNVFIKNLKDLDVTERPIHCTDQKRLQFYVKNEDVWEKDNAKLHASIEQVSKKQSLSINEWTEANPNYMDSSKKCDEYFKIVNETTQSTDDKNVKYIKKSVGYNVKLEKENM
jgi:hypothetical protein